MTRAAPPVSAPPLMSQDTTKPSPQMTATQAMMASMSQQSVPQQQLLRLPPQGVQAPQPIRAPLMMAPRPVVPVMLPARAPQPILPPQPVLGKHCIASPIHLRLLLSLHQNAGSDIWPLGHCCEYHPSTTAMKGFPYWCVPAVTLTPWLFIGVPLGARFGGAMAPVQLRPVLPPQPVAMADDEPPSKKQKTEESLIPEHQWLAQRPVSVWSLTPLANFL